MERARRAATGIKLVDSGFGAGPTHQQGELSDPVLRAGGVELNQQDAGSGEDVVGAPASRDAR